MNSVLPLCSYDVVNQKSGYLLQVLLQEKRSDQVLGDGNKLLSLLAYTPSNYCTQSCVPLSKADRARLQQCHFSGHLVDTVVATSEVE